MGGFHQNAEEEDQYSFQGSINKSQAESISVHQVAALNINNLRQTNSDEKKMDD